MRTGTPASASVFFARCVLCSVKWKMFAAETAEAKTIIASLPPPAARPIDFVTDIQPLFKGACYQCHGPRKQEAGLRFDHKATALGVGGDVEVDDARCAESGHFGHGVAGGGVSPPQAAASAVTITGKKAARMRAGRFTRPSYSN